MSERNHDGDRLHQGHIPLRVDDVQGLWITTIPCGEGENLRWISRVDNARFPLFLGAFHATHILIHRSLWIGRLALGVAARTLIGEGHHPRANSDGDPRAHTRLRREGAGPIMAQHTTA